MLRGAPISDEERKELNLKAGRLFESLGIYMSEYDEVKKIGYVGYGLRSKNSIKSNFHHFVFLCQNL